VPEHHRGWCERECGEEEDIFEEADTFENVYHLYIPILAHSSCALFPTHVPPQNIEYF
jgi:hypothetical protein